MSLEVLFRLKDSTSPGLRLPSALPLRLREQGMHKMLLKKITLTNTNTLAGPMDIITSDLSVNFSKV